MVAIELVDCDFITQEEILLPDKFISLFPYVKQVYELYHKVHIPQRKINTVWFKQLISLLNDEPFLFDSHQHYLDLKSLAEFLLAENAVEKLADLLCQQLSSMTCNEIAIFYELQTSDQQQRENRNKLDELLTTYFESLEQ
jgi:hypothetical protein